MRFWLGARLLRMSVALLAAGQERYHIIPASKLPDWLSEYLEYLEREDAKAYADRAQS